MAASKIPYRPEIDGMRALAVGSVVLFHMGLPFAGGGFAGVDVFFVISGFLITSLIDAEMRERRFSFAAFYERRIRRLLPPLIPVLLATWLVSFALLNVWQFADFARSLRAALGLSANWHFFSTVGYFDGPAETKPLLHFWSLAVEEQFYLFFPLLLLGLWRLKARWRGPVVSGLGIASLAFGVYLVATGKSDSAFFHSLARFWEILAGSALALMKSPVRSRRSATLLELVGLATLLGLFVYPDARLFPLEASALAVFGAMLLIAGNGQGAIASPVLQSAPFVATGKISYSVYLWHWPIIVVLKTAYPDAGFTILGAGMAVAIALATISYWMLERPFRMRIVMRQRRSIFAFFVLTTVGLGALSVANYLPVTSGLKASLSVAIRGLLYGSDIGAALFALDEAGGEVARFDVYFDGNSGPFNRDRHLGLPCSFDNGNTPEAIMDCLVGQSGRSNVLVIGDSIGRDTLYALRSGYPDINFLMLHQSSCPPADRQWPGQKCFSGLLTLLSILRQKIAIKEILLAYRYLPESWQAVEATLKGTKALRMPITLLGVSPVLQRTLSAILKEMPPGSAVPDYISKLDRDLIGWDIDELTDAARDLAAKNGVKFVQTTDFYCSATKCSLWLEGDHESPIFWDAQHLTSASILAFGRFLSSLKFLDLSSESNSTTTQP
jgi:peptidoglycan/LPS O-acetylase OafA/YrhL